MADKRIVITFREKGRKPTMTEWMPPDVGEGTFGELAKALEESGAEGDRWLRVGETVVVRAREVHDIRLEEYVPVVLPKAGERRKSIWDREF